VALADVCALLIAIQ